MTTLRAPEADRASNIEGGRRDIRVILGQAAAGLGILLTVYGLVALIGVGRSDVITRDFVPIYVAWALGFGVLAWLAMPGQPGNRAVWVTAVSTFFAGLGTAGLATMVLVGERAGFDMAPTLEGMYGLTPAQLPSLAAISFLFVFQGWLSAMFLVLTLGFLLFPDGELLSPRWKWVAWAALVVVPIAPIVFSWEWHPGSEVIYNAGSPSFTGVGRLAVVLIPALVVLVALSVSSVLLGFQRSTGHARQQYKSIAWGGGFFFTVLVPIIATQSAVPEAELTHMWWRRFGLLLAVIVLVTSYGVAVARYRLYDIDVVINRTVVFVLLAGFIMLVYAVVVVGIGGLIGSGEGFVLPVVATALVAVAFEPVLERAQKWANRVVYRRRATPYEVLSDLTKRLAVAEEGQGILVRMARLLRDGTGADRAAVWSGSPGALDPLATWPAEEVMTESPALDAEHVFAVHDRGEVVGALEVVKPRGSVLSHQERSLVEDVAGSAGAVLGFQRLNDSLAQRAAEVSASRTRLVGAQDEERRRLERDLHESTERLIVSLRKKIEEASELASEHHSDALLSLLASLTHETQVALDEVRSLAKGIYPPVLESDGLVAAVSELSAGVPVEVRLRHTGVRRYPIDLEAALYFDISEAVTNAVKHAAPPIEIELFERDGELGFTVSDAGPGFDQATTPRGSGLENMADRLDAIGGQLDIDSSPGEATVVWGRIDVGEGVVV